MTEYSITEMAAKFHVTASTLRYYEEIGLLTHVGRRHQRRVYTDMHVGRMGTICCFKATGMSLDELQALFSYEAQGDQVQAVIDLLQHHADSLTDHINELKRNQVQIRRKLAFYQAIQQAQLAGRPAPNWHEFADQDFSDQALAKRKQLTH